MSYWNDREGFIFSSSCSQACSNSAISSRYNGIRDSRTYSLHFFLQQSIYCFLQWLLHLLLPYLTCTFKFPSFAILLSLHISENMRLATSVHLNILLALHNLSFCILLYVCIFLQQSPSCNP